jgi:hypothetical protein
MRPTPLSTHALLTLYYSLPPGTQLEDRLVAYGLAVQAHCLGPTDPTTRVSLQSLDLPQRIYGALRRAGYVYADEVSCLADKQLLCVKDFGPGSLVTLRKALGCVAA